MQASVGSAIALCCVAVAAAVSATSRRVEGKRPGDGSGLHQDGSAIDSDGFWLSMRRRKMLLVILLAMLIALRLFGVGFCSATVYGHDRQSLLISHAAWTIAYIVTLSLALVSVSTHDVRKHWQHVLHLAAITGLALFLSLAIIVLALSRRRQIAGDKTAHHRRRITIPDALMLLDVLFLLLTTALVWTMPKSPELRFEPRVLTGSGGSKQDDAPHSTGSNVSPLAWASPLSQMLFSWVGPIITTGSSKPQLDPDDLPVMKATFRTTRVFRDARANLEKEPARSRRPRWFNPLLWRLIHHNGRAFTAQFILAIITSVLYYGPALFLNRLVAFLEQREDDPKSKRTDLAQGYAYVIGLLVAILVNAIVEGQLWYLSNSEICSKIRTQLNTLVFAKSLRRKDTTGGVASSASSDTASEKFKLPGQMAASEAAKPSASTAHLANQGTSLQSKNERAMPVDDEADDDADTPTFATKGQVLNLFSIDSDRVSDFSNWSFCLIDAPMEMLIGTIFLYQLLGSAALIGIAINIFFIPLNHWTSKAFATTQDRLMSARDKRVALTSEALSAIRMLKFMAWEKPFEDRILVARKAELKQQRINYWLEVAFNFLWTLSPVFSVVVSFLVYTKVQGHALTPSKAFTSIAVLDELRFALNVIPDTLVSGLQSLVSLRRIQTYLEMPEVDIPLEHAHSSLTNGVASETVALRDATITWPSVSLPDLDSPRSGASTPRRMFLLSDLNLTFPNGQLSLICGPLGSGKTLLLLALLGEADLLGGQIICPRSEPDAIAAYEDEAWAHPTLDNWLTKQCAYVPQSSWLQNASVQDNILFGLPMIKSRYEAVLDACSLTSDLNILEDGDQTEIGERGVNLSGGQKARVSLARAVYSRASYLFLDDVLSAVDAHTADHIFNKCLKGELMQGRTILLVSHHVQLILPGADYVALLDNGILRFAGSALDFSDSPHRRAILDTQGDADELDQAPKAHSKPVNKFVKAIRESNGILSDSTSGTSSEESSSEEESEAEEPQKPRKLIEDEARAVGHVSPSVWAHWIKANGGALFWIAFAVIFLGAQVSEVGETWWLRIWSGSYGEPHAKSVDYYLGIYTLISIVTVIVDTLREVILYEGAIRASTTLYKQLLRSVLRAKLRMFDTVPLGRLLNRFAKDMEGIDSQLPDNVGRTLEYSLSVLTTIVTISSVTPIFLVGFAVLSVFYFHRGRQYTKTARELRRLDSVSKSPLFSLYSEAISGVAVIRAFGASNRFMGYMLWRAETNLNFFYSLWSVNRWLSVRFALLSALVIGLTAAIVIQTSAPAAVAGFALTFALNISSDMLFLVRRFTALELSMVAVERVKEYSEIEHEAAEYVEPRPPASWPHSGDLRVEKLCVRYSDELPDVLHDISFSAPGGTKIGIVGPTGCGKSTLALSFFRFVEAHAGRIVIDGLDIANVGLRDLRSRITIIPQDPTILSGTLRSALDVFDEHEDIELYSSLRRVHLLPSIDQPTTATDEGENENTFQNLDSEVTEGGTNFSVGQRQLIVMARALLKRTKLVLMDEATSNVDYKTDELISKTIAREFTDSSLLVIAHRLRTVITFDKILLLDAGRVIEYDKPSTLLKDSGSHFYRLCQATGKREFKILQRMADGAQPARPLPRPRKSRTASSQPVKKKRTFSNGYVASAE